MTKRKSTKRESDESLIEVFGTPRPHRRTIARWKATWRDTRPHLEVKNFNSTINLLNSSNVDPLFYQFYADPNDNSKFYVVFFKNEHEVFFKLHSGIS